MYAILSNNSNESVKNLDDTIQKITDKIEILRKEDVSEEISKSNLVLPMVGGWGYDVYDFREIEPEKRTKGGDVVDYALKIPYKGKYKTIFYVEVKKVGNLLSDLKAIKQCVGYATSDGVPLGIVTNGDRYILIDPTDPGDLINKIILIIQLSTKKNIQFFQLLHLENLKQAASSGNLDRYINYIKLMKIFGRGEFKSLLHSIFIEETTKYSQKNNVDLKSEQFRELLGEEGVENFLLYHQNKIIQHNSIFCANFESSKNLKDDIITSTFTDNVMHDKTDLFFSLVEFIEQVENLFHRNIDLIIEMIETMEKEIFLSDKLIVKTHKNGFSIYCPEKVFIYIINMEHCLKTWIFTDGIPFDNLPSAEEIYNKNGRERYYGDKHGVIKLKDKEDIQLQKENFRKSFQLIRQAIEKKERTSLWGDYLPENPSYNNKLGHSAKILKN